MEGTECHCQQQLPKPHSIAQRKALHVVKLMLDHFVAPVRVLHLLDPQQADHFRRRNPEGGCCGGRHVAIPPPSRTRTENWLAELLTPGQLLLQLEPILTACAERQSRILASGRQDGLKVSAEAEKFVLDKVVGQVLNSHLSQLLRQRAEQQARSLHSGIALWATPASWLQRYPGSRLDSLPGVALAELLGEGWAVVENWVQSPPLVEECMFLERDGRFEDEQWVKGTKGKVLSCPQSLCQLPGTGSLPHLREALLALTSLPFELNQRANLFCTASNNTHLLRASGQFPRQSLASPLRFCVLVALGQLWVQVGGRERVVRAGDLVLVDSRRAQLSVENKHQDVLFTLRSFIGQVDRK